MTTPYRNWNIYAGNEPGGRYIAGPFKTRQLARNWARNNMPRDATFTVESVKSDWYDTQERVLP